MKLKRLIASLAAAALGLAGCASVETPPRGAVPGPALWRVADKDTTIYLFGTVHALPKDSTWFDARIERAFTEADELVTEVDVSDLAAAQQTMLAAGTLPEGASLRERMSPENRIEYEAALVGLGVPVQTFDRIEPWLASIMLTLMPLIQAGYDQESGVELALGGRAGDKKRGGLETLQEQIALFDALPMAEQLKYLDETVEQLPTVTASLDALVAEWIEGDAPALAAMLNAELTDPALHQRLLVARNARWAEWLERRMEEPGTVFVAVGAGHLSGEGSVQDHLRRRGIRVRRIWE